MASNKPRITKLPDEGGEQRCRRLEGREAVVTGAAGGIGTAITRRCLQEGAVVIAVDRPVAKLKTSLASMLSWPCLHLVACDVTSKRELTQLVSRTIKAHRRINVLFNNAGVNGNGDELLSMTTEEWERVMAVNLTATFHLSQLVSRHMVSHGNGVIVNTTSQLSTVAVKNNANYLTSKGALLQFTRAAALELAPFGV